MRKSREANLLSMGYRKYGKAKGTWAKPLGHTILTFEFARAEFTQWFIGKGGTTGRWVVKEVQADEEEHGDFLRQIKEFEVESGKVYDPDYSQGRTFEFVSPAELSIHGLL